jgi:acetyltransferase
MHRRIGLLELSRPMLIDTCSTPDTASREGGADARTSGQTESDADAYPAHVAGRRRAVNGTTLEIRPIAPADGQLIRDFVRSLSFETRYLRFMSAVKELSTRDIEQLTGIEHRRDAALLALVKEDGADRVIGVARYALAADGEDCEFAIVVADDWQDRGLGHLLMMLLIDTAGARGVKRIVGDVLAINRPMLSFVRELGFRVAPSSDDPTIWRVERDLDSDRLPV